jgi:hypothetical protein
VAINRLQKQSRILQKPREWLGYVYVHDIWLQLALLVFMLIVYGAILIGARLFPSAQPGSLNLTFNSMLERLLHGRFDVDPEIVGNEGFLRDGHVYAYWGIWCALIRIPLWLVHRMNWDVTLWSCLAAVCLATSAKVRTLLFLRQHSPSGSALNLAFGLMLIDLLLGGSAIGFLKSSLYQEVVFWVAAFAAIFVYLAIRGLVSRAFDCALLCGMALCAGLAVLTRVSTGIGLVLAFGLLELVLAAQAVLHGEPGESTVLSRVARAITARRVLFPFAILFALLLLTATVNYFRWGHAQTFADYRYYLMNAKYPDRPLRIAQYGLFNIERIPFGLIYYFFPVWVLPGGGGQLLLESQQQRLIDAWDLPPSSFLLTDLLPLAFIALGVCALRRRSKGYTPFLGQSMAIAIGLLAPCLLMLTAVHMSYRYRMEFYPEIDLLAFLGFYSVVSDARLGQRLLHWSRSMVGALAVSTVSSVAILALFYLSGPGAQQLQLRQGIVHYYQERLQLHLARFRPSNLPGNGEGR